MFTNTGPTNNDSLQGSSHLQIQRSTTQSGCGVTMFATVRGSTRRWWFAWWAIVWILIGTPTLAASLFGFVAAMLVSKNSMCTPPFVGRELCLYVTETYTYKKIYLLEIYRVDLILKLLYIWRYTYTQYIYLSIYLYLSIYRSVDLFIYLSIYRSIYRSIYLSDLSICVCILLATWYIMHGQRRHK